MGISDARKRANKKWINENTEEIKVRVPKGKKNSSKSMLPPKRSLLMHSSIVRWTKPWSVIAHKPSHNSISAT